MTTYSGNQQVKSGYYLSTRSFAVEVIGDQGGTLPGDTTTRYLAVPFPALLAIAPVVGLGFVLSLPLVGFALVGYALVRRVSGHVSERAGALAATVAPPQATGAAYLGGREGEKKNDEVSPEIEKLEKEVSDQRKDS